MGDMITSPPSIPQANNQQVASISAKIMVVAMIVLFFVVAFCFFLSLYARWYWSRNEDDPSAASWRRRTARQGQLARARPKRKGLDQATLKALPVISYEPKDFKEELECSVCLSEVSQGEKVRLLPECNHGFHVECIDMWFKSHSTCPLCRNSVVSTTQNQVNDTNHENTNHEMEQVEVTASLSDSESDSDSNSDSDSDHEHGSNAPRANSGEPLNFPTNVLFWGDEVQVRSLGETTNGVATSSSSNVDVTAQRGEIVIEIPRDLPRGSEFDEEEAKTPVVSRLKSFKRLLSRGKRVAPWASGSSSADIEAV